jgi:hypothetical protein
MCNGLTAFGFKNELRRIGRCEGFEELKFNSEQIAGSAFCDRHAAFADFVVADPAPMRIILSIKGFLCRAILPC